jgi:NADPH:quinone reductase
MKEQAQKRVDARVAPSTGGIGLAGRPDLPEHVRGAVAQPAAPGPREIVVRVQACGASRADHIVSAGGVGQRFPTGARLIRDTDAAGTVIAIGDGVTRFAVGDEVFGHFPAESWIWVQAACARATADGPHIERRPEGLDPLAAAALAGAGLTATTMLRAAELRPGQSALVIGATSGTGTVLLPLLAETGVHVIAGATAQDDAYVRSLGPAETFLYATADPVADALARHPGADLLVDLVTFEEPYLITPGAPHGTIVTALPKAGVRELGLSRIRISPEPGDLAALAHRALDGRQRVDIADVHRLTHQSHTRAKAALRDADEGPVGRRHGR